MKDKMSCREAAERTPALVSALAALWERSVRASHDFLTEEEIRRIGGYVPEALFRLGEARYGLRRTTVNEQNPAARRFYERMGMTVRRRTERDEEGGPYPLLYMEK